MKILLTLLLSLALLGCNRRDSDTAAGRPPLGAVRPYDISQYQKTDPQILIGSEAAPLQTHLRQPTGIALGLDDSIHLAGDSNLVHLTTDGSLLHTIPLTDAPRCLAVGRDGRFYIGTRTHVDVYDPRSKSLSSWTTLGENAVISSLAVDTNEIWVADAGNRMVVRFSLSGELLAMIGRKDPAKNVLGFVVPSPCFDLALAPDGKLWIVNPGNLLVENYSREDGRRLSAWGKSGMDADAFCGCCNPSHIAIRPDGSFVTAEKGLPRVKIYDSAGAFVGVVAGPESFDETVVGLDTVVDTRGRILVLDPSRNLVRIFTVAPRGPTEGGR